MKPKWRNIILVQALTCSLRSSVGPSYNCVCMNERHKERLRLAGLGSDPKTLEAQLWAKTSPSLLLLISSLMQEAFHFNLMNFILLSQWARLIYHSSLSPWFSVSLFYCLCPWRMGSQGQTHPVAPVTSCLSLWPLELAVHRHDTLPTK